MAKIWTVQIQVDREILEQLGPNSVPQKHFTDGEISRMECLAEAFRQQLQEQFGYVRMQHEVMEKPDAL